MECNDVRESLPDLVLGAVSAPEEAALRGHIDGCSACRREEESMRRALEAMRAIPGIEPSRARFDAVVAAALAEGTLRPRIRLVRWAVPVAAAAAAAVVLFVAIPSWLPPREEPQTPGIVMGSAPGAEMTSAPSIGHFVDGRDAFIVKEGKAESRPLVKKDALHRGDRILVEGEGGRALLRFSDSLDLDVLGGPGGAEVRIEGVSTEAYRLHLDRGRIFGRFPQPIEIISSRVRGDSFIPLVVASPVGQAEIWKGRGFKAVQDKVSLPENWFEHNKARDAVSLHFRDADLLSLVSRTLAPHLEALTYDPSLLRGRKLTILCNTVPSADLPAALDAALAPLGLKFSVSTGRMAIVARPEGAAAAKAGWKDPAYGEFTLELDSGEGEAKVSSRDPGVRGAATVFGGQKGVIRPGTAPIDPLASAPVEVRTLDRNIELLGTMAADQGSSVAVLGPGDGAPGLSMSVRPGEEIAGYRCERVGWDHLVLTKAGREYRLIKK